MTIRVVVHYWWNENLGFGHISLSLQELNMMHTLTKSRYVSYAMGDYYEADLAKHKIQPINIELYPRDTKTFTDLIKAYQESDYGYYDPEFDAATYGETFSDEQYAEKYHTLKNNCAHCVQHILIKAGYLADTINSILPLRPYKLAQAAILIQNNHLFTVLGLNWHNVSRMIIENNILRLEIQNKQPVTFTLIKYPDQIALLQKLLFELDELGNLKIELVKAYQLQLEKIYPTTFEKTQSQLKNVRKLITRIYTREFEETILNVSKQLDTETAKQLRLIVSKKNVDNNNSSNCYSARIYNSHDLNNNSNSNETNSLISIDASQSLSQLKSALLTVDHSSEIYNARIYEDTVTDSNEIKPCKVVLIVRSQASLNLHSLFVKAQARNDNEFSKSPMTQQRSSPLVIREVEYNKESNHENEKGFRIIQLQRHKARHNVFHSNSDYSDSIIPDDDPAKKPRKE